MRVVKYTCLLLAVVQQLLCFERHHTKKQAKQLAYFADTSLPSTSDDFLPDFDLAIAMITQAIKPVVRDGVLTYVKLCKERDIAVDEKKMIEEIESCVLEAFMQFLESVEKEKEMLKLAVYKIKNNIIESIPLSPREEGVLRHNLLVPACNFVTGLLQCIPIGKGTVTSCVTPVNEAQFAYVKHVLESTCSNNASRILDFLTNGGLGCYEEMQHTSLPCGNVYQILKNFTTIGEFCGALEGLQDCGERRIDLCSNKQAVNIYKDNLRQMNAWSSDTCFNERWQSGGSPQTSSMWFMLLCVTSLLLKILIC